MTQSRLILASQSLARQQMLEQAGVLFESIPAHMDEKVLKKQHQNKTPQELARILAAAKAEKISLDHPSAFVIGSDQILVCEGQIFTKAQDTDIARENLKKLRGKTHDLISAVTIFHQARAIWSHVDTAHMTMKNFSDNFLEFYLDRAGSILTSCVGCYALEQGGVRLFQQIDGDFFTILGMPLLPLLQALEDHQVIS
ncbi:MAG: septum formation protein Maf [Alphaproteobacteria bacterium]|nr:septum formation protein Maf [Alphaproteobacteria bacterium]